MNLAAGAIASAALVYRRRRGSGSRSALNKSVPSQRRSEQMSDQRRVGTRRQMRYTSDCRNAAPSSAKAWAVMTDSKSLYAAALAAVIAFAPPVAAHEPPVQPYHGRASSWQTVVIVEPQLVAPPRPAMRPNAGAIAYGATHRPPVETASIQPPSAAIAPRPRLLGPGHAMDGVASYYWQDQMTANGERFNKRAMTAAHRTLPFGTRVRVTHARTGHSVVVRINDRGPFKKSRVIDLSEAAAEAIGMTGPGLAPVRIDVVSR